MIKREKTMKTKFKHLDYDDAVDNLLDGIKKDYAGWTTWDEGINRFNDELSVKPGRKFDKVMKGTSVWGFVAKKNGVHKGITYFVGDVFKAASWRGPAKHVRGSIFSNGTDWYSWTGPNYL
jgi:hypothetical protein